MLSGTHKTLLGVGAGIGAIGVAAWVAARGSATVRPALDPAPDARAGQTSPSGEPATADGPANLAVAWWPQDISLVQEGDDATLRFQSTIANVGGRSEPLHPGDRLEYTVRRSDDRGAAGEVVGRGSLPLDRADVEQFPVVFGSEVGRDIHTFGRDLEPIHELAPATAAIVGARHAAQAVAIEDARAGTYQLRQQIVRADGSSDVSSFDDVRVTEFILDGRGGLLHTSSRYAGADTPTTTGPTP